MPAAMAWDRLLDTARWTRQGPRRAAGDGRSEFQVDIDRLIFSGAFRRLQGKTQVHPMPENDHVHTRLTHTLEVASVGRSLGEAVGRRLKARDRLPPGLQPFDVATVVQAACLAHDIGNPPFGHAGEFALRGWFNDADGKAYMTRVGLRPAEQADLTLFEGNAQGFRVVAALENNLDAGGLRLTFATLASLVKYPWTAVEAPRFGKQKFGFTRAELPLFEEVAATIGLLPDGREAWVRHPLVHLVEAADDICYALIDLEDGLELGLIGLSDLQDVLRAYFAARQADADDLKADQSRRRQVSYLRSRAIGLMVEDVAAAFDRAEAGLLDGTQRASVLETVPDLAETIARAKDLARRRIFSDRRKTRLEIGAYPTVATLLNSFTDAFAEALEEAGAVPRRDAFPPTDMAPGSTGPMGPAGSMGPTPKMTFRAQRTLEIMGTGAPRVTDGAYGGTLKIADYIAGMTDTYASFLARQLAGG